MRSLDAEVWEHIKTLHHKGEINLFGGHVDKLDSQKGFFRLCGSQHETEFKMLLELEIQKIKSRS